MCCQILYAHSLTILMTISSFEGAILRRHGIFSHMSLPSSEIVEQEWEMFLEKFVKDPGMLSRAADQHRAQTLFVKIF